MNPGDLRHRITLQSEREIVDEYNTPIVGWEDYATVWAAIEPLRGREYLEAKNVTPELTVRIRIRYKEGIDHGMRVKYGTRIFNIQSPPIDVEGRHQEMHLMCSEVFD